MSNPTAATAELEVLRAQDAAQPQQIAELDRCIESQMQDLAARAATLSERDQRLASQQREIKQRDLRIQHPNHEIARLKSLQFSAKTEALSALQRELFANAVAEEHAAVVQALENADSAETASPAEAPIAFTAKAAPKRQALPPELPHITHEPATGCTCATCAAALVKIGAHVTGKLAYTPARFHVERDIYPQCACRACETDVADPVGPAHAPSLLAQVLLAEYDDHLPLFRQRAIFACAGVGLADQHARGLGRRLRCRPAATSRSNARARPRTGLPARR